MPRSKKTEVIDALYDFLFDTAANSFKRTVVTAVDVTHVIDKTGSTLSPRNPANFIKDVIRGKGASKTWPERLKKLRITAKQVTGDGNVFEFVSYAAGQTEPFPDPFAYHAGVPCHRVQTVSIPQATQALGRDDESYLIQVAVKLSIVETHVALFSDLSFVEVNHLQNGIKLRLTEVDALYSANILVNDGLVPIIITCEAKRKTQRILQEQIIQQVKAAFNETRVDFVVPLAITSAPKGIYVAEFASVKRDDVDTLETLTLQSATLYELYPPVQGISK